MDMTELAQSINLGPSGAARRVIVDPPGCGCTECLTGEYVPLEMAKDWQLLLLFTGKAVNNTGLSFEATPDPDSGTVRVTAVWENSGTPVADSVMAGHAEERWESAARGWEITPAGGVHPVYA